MSETMNNDARQLRDMASQILSPNSKGKTLFERAANAIEALDKLGTPNASLPPLVSDGPRRKMLIEIEVSADFERRLDNQWEVEREINADRWSWRWKPDTSDQGKKATTHHWGPLQPGRRNA